MICPGCGTEFDGSAELIPHIERAHGGLPLEVLSQTHQPTRQTPGVKEPTSSRSVGGIIVVRERPEPYL